MREPVQGYGFVVSDRRQPYTALVTAAHLISGREGCADGISFCIQVDGQSMEFNENQVLVDHAKDIALIELESSLPVIPALALEEAGVFLVHKDWTSRFKNRLTLSSSGFDEFVPIPSELESNSCLKAIQHSPHYLKGKYTGVDQATPVGNGPYLASFAKVVPGMSGLPLLKWVGYKEFPYVVLGLTLARDRVFPISYFLGAQEILAQFHRFKKGDRGVRNHGIWRMINQLTFRELKDGTVEVNPVDQFTGKGETADSGGSKSCGPSSHFYSQFYSQYAIQAGMVWRGQKDIVAIEWKDVFALNRLGRLKELFESPIAADMSSYAFFSEAEKQLGRPIQIRLIRLQDRLINLLHARYKLDGNLAQEFTVRGFEYPPAAPKKSQHHGVPTLEFQWNSVQVTIPFFLPTSDTVTFVLNERGGLEDQDFRPLIEVSSTSRKNYLVDLRQFFFRDLSVEQPESGAHNPVPTIRIRRQDLSIGYQIRFAWVTW